MARDWTLSDAAERGAPVTITTTQETRLLLTRIRAMRPHAAPSGIDHPARENLDDMATLLIRLSERIDAQEVQALKHRKKIAFLCSVIKYNVERSRIGFVAADCAVIERKILEEWNKNG